MRLLVLIAVLCLGSLHAAEPADAELPKPDCPAREASEAAGGTPPPGVGADTGGAPLGGNGASLPRNRMTPRWHSMLPGMFR